MQDEQIVELIWNRKESGLKELGDKYGKRMQDLAERYLQAEDAGECVNDTYMAVWKSIPPHKPQFLFAYVAKICRNLALNRVEWNNAAKRNATVIELSKELQECIPDKEVEWQQEELGRLLSLFLWGLSEEKRQIFVRRYWYGSSVKEIADWSGYSESKIKSILFRTRNLLREYLKKEGIEV